ncbi:hypothetical protein [Deinococcus roseus]|uniref:Uncharacterized protein n=1 Tax=Deinococcus roseus TaxID=392414 RepID=A0ABQ2D5I7_9DEIO|nr:hypothetical protein [Deinococcus roseus]GGJ45877.1 hypothetical protein GCM10008938_35160 [Deinococcus roseus]
MPALKWIGRKLIALLGAALVVSLFFAGSELWNGRNNEFTAVPRFFEGLLTFAFFAVYFGALPALITTGISDLISPRLGSLRKPAALVIHLLGSLILIFMLFGGNLRISSSDWLFVWLSVGAALVFFLLDEFLKTRFYRQSSTQRI